MPAVAIAAVGINLTATALAKASRISVLTFAIIATACHMATVAAIASTAEIMLKTTPTTVWVDFSKS